jgi:hypothetical protein
MDYNKSTPRPLRRGLGALCTPDPPLSAWTAQTGRHQAVKVEAATRGRDSASLYGLRPVRFTAVSCKRTGRRTVWPKGGNRRPHRT